ncbi:MAG: hypothetical protein KIH69_003140 [Anaerolineae bacterium]|nr:hypothetical protein [Anaerolineae bacterium]
MNNQQFTPFPTGWLENLTQTAEIALDNWLTHHAPQNIKNIVEMQNCASQYVIERDNVSPETHQAFLDSLSSGMSAIAEMGVNFNTDEGILTHDNPKQ